ncbi:hypothetical protein CEXT_609511 [Caerostris extrusa]|uniref:Uncharacterized protein n=1 Tax=Caerostris extrusa TaxID=172846 RepID=A0AAV4T1E6_CAEEX|nr:hypothetical protein CEXT_609511 [Caerostris extrusa]
MARHIRVSNSIVVGQLHGIDDRPQRSLREPPCLDYTSSITTFIMRGMVQTIFWCIVMGAVGVWEGVPKRCQEEDHVLGDSCAFPRCTI